MKKNSATTGAAFLMATSAIGPGFLTQTSLFTEQLLASFGFVILISVLIDIGAQLNIWRIITVSETRAQDIANKILPGSGYFLASLIVFGGLVFNIGNVAGAGLGINILTGIDLRWGAVVSGVIALSVFWMGKAGSMIDVFVKTLGILMIGLTLYVVFASHPPLGDALYRTLWPKKVNVMMIVTLVGGTVGGYISFAGAHRLLDAGIKGKSQIRAVSRSSVNGIFITSLMRFILFLAVLGIVSQGIKLDPGNPASTVFQSATGRLGYYFFGLVIWSASITSVVGASYTSVSFWKTLHPLVRKYEKGIISCFIIFSTLIFTVVGKPVNLLIIAGAVNGLILPIALAVILISVHKYAVVKDYKHPIMLEAAGWIVVILMTGMGFAAIQRGFQKLF